MLFRLMTLLLGRFWPAAVASAVYALHPIHVEAVVPIVGRSELLGGLAVVSALVLYVQDASRGGRGLTWRYVVVLLLTWAAILCKESAIVLIGMVVVFDVWRRLRTPTNGRTVGWQRYVVSRFLWRYAGMLMAVVIVLWMRQWAIGTMFGQETKFPLVDNPLIDQPWTARVLTGFVLLGTYVRLLLTGHPLSADYSYNAIPVASSISWPVACGMACAVGLVVVAVASLRRRGPMALALGWLLVSYAPVANVFVLIGTLFAERLMYVPSIPVAMLWGLAIPAGVTWLWRRESNPTRLLAIVLVGATVATLVTYSVLTVLRNRVWHDDEALFRDTLAKQPRSARAQFNMGAWYASHGETEVGVEHLRRAVEIADEFFLARTKLANCYFTLSRWQDVVDVLEPLVESTDSKSEHLIPPLYMLGKARVRLADPAGAWSCFERIRQIDPAAVEAMRCQAEILARPDAGQLYNPMDAWTLIQKVVDLAPNNLACLASGARIALRQRRFVEARLYLRRALEAVNERIEQAKAKGLDPNKDRSIRMIVRDLKTMRDELRRQTKRRRQQRLSPTTRRHPRRQPTTTSRPD
jgi:hypothetical protein